ncbi:uncharacterized protein simc1 isoform X1 [Pseudochaenichthys georgianus]|uniref:uncharacterized protein simc1 isoform X1 n=2 Tax=Pseudochaenichthys georgianus TaxID=52239 RepID=UPI00146EC205|nr:SUMO-interacting motif-containing protein 1 isoform X1 [Pseudochaenichthys georgianus]
MDEPITISSDSDTDDSDVEFIDCFSNVVKLDDPLTAARVDVDTVKVNIPTLYIDLSNTRWTFPELKSRKRLVELPKSLVELPETNVVNRTKPALKNFSPDNSETKIPNKHNLNLRTRSSRYPTVKALKQDCGHVKPKKRCLDSQTQLQMAHYSKAFVKLRRLAVLESHVADLKTLKCSVLLNKDCTQMSLHRGQQDLNVETPECNSNLSTTLNGPHMDSSLAESPSKVGESLIRQEENENGTQLNAEISQHLEGPADPPCSDKGCSVETSKEHSTHEGERDDLSSFIMISSPTSPSLSPDKAEHSQQREVLCSKLKQMKLDKAESMHSFLADPSFPSSPPTGPNPCENVVCDSPSHTSPISHNLMRHINPATISENTPAGTISEGQSEDVKADDASNRSDVLLHGIHDEPFISVANEDMDDTSWAGTYGDYCSPGPFIWQEGSDGDEVNKESRFDLDFRAASREDRHFVCPIELRKIMFGHAQALPDEEDEDFGAPEVLCRQSLGVVYTTIEEKLTEGTLQHLSDLLQPGYYPPKDITSHLLRGVLLDHQCPYHRCVQAFNLLMRTQRHHMADTTSAPWDWELLTSVMANQDCIQKYRREVVRMLLDYVVQTLEDDFQAKRSISALHHSIAKTTLSCDEQFPHIREIIKWLFAAIRESTEPGDSREAARERDEQTRMVSTFQRMLTLALEVDRSPALTSAKLSQELFHILISNTPLRAHRMLLLESLQSKLLRCKLLEQLLDYSCPLKITLPMSLSLLLHFLKHCTLAPDPSDGTERWQRWEELVHLLWMLLLSYNKAMKGYLSNSISEQRGRVGNLVYRPDDMVSKPAICDAMQAFRSRSQADLGQTLPLHVEESLTYLQDHLLDVCQC